MTFDELLGQVSSGACGEVRIDSRQVHQGDVFVAMQGASCDGHAFIGQALANGAKYVVHAGDHAVAGDAKGATLIPVDSPAKAAGQLAQAKRGNPGNLNQILARVPDVPPQPGDER